MQALGGSGSEVVAHFRDGRVLKGTTHDFAPNKSAFHLIVRGEGASRGVAVPLGSLKAVFFVKDFDGDRRHVEDLDVSHAKGLGRRIVVSFADGEIVSGITTGYAPDKPGFFVIPTDPASNNARVFVVAASIKKVEWPRGEASPAAGATGSR